VGIPATDERSEGPLPVRHPPGPLPTWELTVERIIRSLRKQLSHSLRKLELVLHVRRVAKDPATKTWIRETDVSIADGTMKQMVADQPSVAELAERWRKP
jgi:hypothetical protein